MSISGKAKLLKALYARNRRWIGMASGSKAFYTEEAPHTFDLDELLTAHEAVFTLSTGRCGTMSLAELLRLSDRCHVYHHAEPELTLANRFAYESAAQQTPDGMRLALLAVRGELILEAHKRRRRYVETNRYLTFFASGLHQLLPSARFIHLVRDPRAFIRSGLARNYYSHALWNATNILPDVPLPDTNDPLILQVHRIAALWVETNRFIDAFKASTSEGTCVMVRAEDLFGDPSTTQSLFEFLHLAPPRPSRAAGILRRPRNATASGRQVTDFPAESLAGYASFREMAEQYGYSTDWISASTA